MSGTSFYWAMRLLPAAKRDAIFAVYRYCRALDDIADGELAAEAKRARLAGFRRDLDALFAGGRPAEAEVAALAPAVARHALPKAELEALIDGMAMDVDGPIVAPGLDELLLYCRRVAGAVGMLAVRVFGRPDAEGLAVVLGEALQLTNILRDVAEDAALGRLYLPAELLADAGIGARDPALVATHPHLPAACAALARLAEQRFAAADAELARLGGRGLWPARVMMATYRLLLARLVRHGWAATPAPRVRPVERLWIALKTAAVGS